MLDLAIIYLCKHVDFKARGGRTELTRELRISAQMLALVLEEVVHTFSGTRVLLRSCCLWG